MRPIHLVGQFLWRAGLPLVGAYALIETARFVLRFWRLPLQLEIGVGCALAGLVLVVVSLVAERIKEHRAEGDLRS